MGILDSAPVPRRTMVLFFIVDTSGSMDGTKIGSVNAAIREVTPMLDEISSNNADAEIKIAVLQFSSGCEWMYDEPKSASEFRWIDMEADGLTDLGAAYQELSSKLSRNAFLNEATGSFAPVLILLSDGEPTDDYQRPLEKLKENKWYKAAIKIAIAIGSDANRDVLKEFTNSSEAVIEVHNVEALKKLIRTVSVTASQIGSQSSAAGVKDKQTQVTESITKEVEQIDGASSSAAPAIGSSSDDDWD
ncbi:MAG: VWA domain-containing protein [Mariniphaga sp.]|nr:VWA domain-containing protein [Mariniphaga sp.]